MLDRIRDIGAFYSYFCYDVRHLLTEMGFLPHLASKAAFYIPSSLVLLAASTALGYVGVSVISKMLATGVIGAGLQMTKGEGNSQRLPVENLAVVGAVGWNLAMCGVEASILMGGMLAGIEGKILGFVAGGYLAAGVLEEAEKVFSLGVPGYIEAKKRNLNEFVEEFSSKENQLRKRPSNITGTGFYHLS
jgi:hypothetical protein